MRFRRPTYTGKTLAEWEAWLTDARLDRWNYLRSREGQAPITRGIGAQTLARIGQPALDTIKARIAE